MTVSELLTQSRAAHAAYRALPAKHPGQRDQWALALDFRLQADALDPTHADPSWGEDRAPSAELVAFYRKKLGLAS